MDRRGATWKTWAHRSLPKNCRVVVDWITHWHITTKAIQQPHSIRKEIFLKWRCKLEQESELSIWNSMGNKQFFDLKERKCVRLINGYVWTLPFDLLLGLPLRERREQEEVKQRRRWGYKGKFNWTSSHKSNSKNEQGNLTHSHSH